MKIAVVSVCKDEEKILPWFLRHYDFADEIHIHDNGSTDRSIEIMRANPKVHIQHFDTGGKLNDKAIIDIKNNYYRTLDADWSIIVDTDEFIWYPSDIRSRLIECQKTGIELPMTQGYNMWGDGWPVDDGKTQLVNIIKMGMFDVWLSKFAVIYKTININYSAGAHNCAPVTASKYFMFSRAPIFKLLHYNYIDIDWWVNKHRTYLKNYSDWNHKNIGLCKEHNAEAIIVDRIRKNRTNCIDVLQDQIPKVRPFFI